MPNIPDMNAMETAVSGIKNVLQEESIVNIDKLIGAINGVSESIKSGDFQVERDRAMSEETRIDMKVDAEVSRATAVEQELRDQLDDVVAAITPAYEHYVFRFNNNESDPSSKITYPDGCDNTNYAPARMNFGGMFDYGSWANAFFIKNLRVVMLNFDGTVAYEINKNDYTKKVDGTAVGTEGNVMVAIPRVYYKIVNLGNGIVDVHFSDVQIDPGYECWAHHGIDGTHKNELFVAVYNAWVDEQGRGRSLSGHLPTMSIDTDAMIAAAELNNPVGEAKHWYISVAASEMLISLLTLLIGKTTDSQSQFGQGRSAGEATIESGTMDTKGLFWGSDDPLNGVKMFGICNAWGNVWIRCAGWICDMGQEKIKFTYGTEDGSSVIGYNTTGEGYIPTSNNYNDFETENGHGYQKSVIFNKFGYFPDANTVGQGSATTDMCDYHWWRKTVVTYLLNRGGYGPGARVGVAVRPLNSAPSWVPAGLGFSLLCTRETETFPSMHRTLLGMSLMFQKWSRANTQNCQ